MADKLDFHKVSENEDFEVYEARTRLKTKEMKAEDGSTIPAPVKYGPVTFKNLNSNLNVLDDALEVFDGYELDSITFGRNGVSVRVIRDKDMPYEEEPDVPRLKTRAKKGGGK